MDAHVAIQVEPSAEDPIRSEPQAEVPTGSDGLLAVLSSIADADTEDARREHVAELENYTASSSVDRAVASLLIEAVRSAGDHDVAMAAQRALGGTPDASVLLWATTAYLAATNDLDADRLLGIIRHVQRPDAVPALSDLTDLANGDYAHPLAAAAADTLGVIGTPAAVTGLLSRIERSSLEGADVMPLVTALSRTLNPRAFAPLAAAATGKGTRNFHARLAAIQALGNYWTDDARACLQSIVASESDPALRTAAERALQRARGVADN